MLRALLYDRTTGSLREGGAELIAQWQAQTDTLIWLDLQDEPAERETSLLQSTFDLHLLAIQDAQRSRHPPKIEAFQGHTFLLFKGLSPDSHDLAFSTLQLALFVGERFLVTRHAVPSLSTNRLWAEVKADSSRFARGTDALLLRLVRLLIDRYLGILLDLEPRLERLEEEMLEGGEDAMLAELTGYKTELKKLRRIFLYHEHVLRELKQASFPAVRPELRHEITDVYEQQERATSLSGLYYELASDLIDGYLSIASHRLNQIMKVLTIVTAIFVPLGFLAGIYGMNFENMPELSSRAGYFILLAVMATIVTTLLILFRRIKWL